MLERLTTVVLVLVLAALAWMAVADSLPAPWRLLAIEVEIAGILGILIAALLLVGLLALLHSHDRSFSASSEIVVKDSQATRRLCVGP